MERQADLGATVLEQEVSFGPTGESSEYCYEVFDLSGLASQLPEQAEFGTMDEKYDDGPQTRHRWISAREIEGGRTDDGFMVGSVVWAILSHLFSHELAQ